SWTEFQPRFGFAWDPKGTGRTVIRGGYGIFYDQLFQNLTLFSLTQSNPVLYQTILSLTNSEVGVGQLPTFRFGIDPLPQPPPGFSIADLAVGGFGRINDPDASEPYVQKFSIGFERQLNSDLTLSSDYVHTLGLHEPRVQVINPRIENICNPAYPGSNPASTLCVRGLNSRLFDRAFVDAGFPANRIEQINMIGTTNRSLFDSWTTTLRWRTRKYLFSGSYVLASSRSWGGQPVASYSGNGIATTPENQFKPEEFGPTRLDERHRLVLSGVFNLRWGLQLAPILQLASSRPFSANTGIDIDGDGLATNDRLCAGVDPGAVFAVRGNSAAIRALNPPGCVQAEVNSLRHGRIVEPSGTIRLDQSGRFFNVDMRISKMFRFGERFNLSTYLDVYNLTNTENLSYASRLALSTATAAGSFLQPVSLYGPGFGPPVGRPLTAQLGFRFTF
ncbi:MAG TPA: hypothetical protein VFR78_12300, partial [Pyrinomonadaceae bacterium]|nr:hypothetical protein [Pyrinomonadaceae bacterium]